MMAAMQFIVSTPDIQYVLESHAGIPLQGLIDLSVDLQHSSAQISSAIFEVLPYNLPMLESLLLTVGEVTHLNPVTNIYRTFPNAHGIVMTP